MPDAWLCLDISLVSTEYLDYFGSGSRNEKDGILIDKNIFGPAPRLVAARSLRLTTYMSK